MEKKILQSLLLHEGFEDREGRDADTQTPFFLKLPQAQDKVGHLPWYRGLVM